MRKLISTTLAATLLATGFAVPTVTAKDDDQDKARKEMRAGNVLSLREIERRVLPRMRGAEYLGPYYDAAAMAYRLKFIRNGRVMFVDIDARSGRIISQSR
ncbi:PepSY domain-containing protein [Altererythrobacter sp. ZODW24]|uniref:PepSY domain-containing protein n=1 Tax=Altererythrobacter sp. ZODW24 TaxID=2185142 RepID=UPI000DF77ACC|nr:PepSY domain-containing protein [Altererythrobacter sp. ZODW24]